MTGPRISRSAVTGYAASLRKNGRPAICALFALAGVVLFSAGFGLSMRQSADAWREAVTESRAVSPWSVPLTGLVKGQLPSGERMSTSVAVPGGENGTAEAAADPADVLRQPDVVLPEGLIAEWYGGQPMDADALRRTLQFVTRTLRPDGSWCSKNVHDLLMETAAVETALGYLVRQQNGPALSVWQILGFNFVETREYFAKKDPGLLERAMSFYNTNRSEDWNRVHNIPWTAAMSILYYEKASMGTFLVKLDTLDSRGKLWKDIYNTRLGKGTVRRYKQRALEYVHMAMGPK